MSRFDVRSPKLFLTYPECPITKDEAYAQLSAKLLVRHYIIASELHANGHQHLHVYLELQESKRFRDARFADLLLDSVVYHGNYQGCRSWRRVVEYVTKGADYISDLQVDSIVIGKRLDRNDLCDSLLKKNKRLCDLVSDHPALLYDIEKLQRGLTIFKELSAQAPPVPKYLPNPWGRVIRYDKPSKRRHWWIFSRVPNRGKTFHFAIPLNREFGFFIANGDFTYWNVDSTTPGVILDDYNSARLKWHTLNQLCDGTYNFRVAHRGVVHLNYYIVIVLSIFSISDLYPNMNQFLYERFTEYEC